MLDYDPDPSHYVHMASAGSITAVTTTHRIDKRSPSWLSVESWAAAELAERRLALEIPGTDPVLTEGHRQAIAVLKILLSLPDDQDINPYVGHDTGYGLGV